MNDDDVVVARASGREAAHSWEPAEECQTIDRDSGVQLVYAESSYQKGAADASKTPDHCRGRV